MRLSLSDRGRSPQRLGLPRGESGDTLIEVLIALVVIGLTVTALLGAFATAISASAEDRNLATIDTLLQSFAETATYQIQLQPNPSFAPCSASYTLSPSFVHPAGYTVTIASVSYWSSTQFVATCVASSTAPQLITASVKGPNGSAGVLAFVVDDPTFAQSAATFTSASSVTVTHGTSMSFTVTTTGVPAAALTETGALPAGVTFVPQADGSALLSGSLGSTIANYPLTITATNAAGATTQSFSLNVS
jgi:Tfp pilus assembly protein PilV